MEPENIQAYEALGDSYLQAKQVAQALRSYRAGLERSSDEQPDQLVAKIAALQLELRALEEGLAFLNEAIGERFVEELELLRRQFLIAMAMGAEKREAVLESTRWLHTGRPENAHYAFDLAQLLTEEKEAEAKEQLKDAKGALQDLNSALALPGVLQESLLERRALLFAKAGVPDKAIQDFTRLIKEQGEEAKPRWYYQLGLAYSKKDDKKQAVKMLLKADTQGDKKAAAFLQEKFPKQALKVRLGARNKLQAEYDTQWLNNKQSSLLQGAFGKLWVPNMQKFIEGS